MNWNNLLSRLVVAVTAVVVLGIATPTALYALPDGKKPAKASATVKKYECPACHMKFSASQAKKMKMQCEHCKKKLVAVKTASATQYECPGCHMKFSAAEARKANMECAHCNMKLTAVKK